MNIETKWNNGPLRAFVFLLIFVGHLSRCVIFTYIHIHFYLQSYFQCVLTSNSVCTFSAVFVLPMDAR